MANVCIDLKRVRETNSSMPGMISSIEGAKRKAGLLKWRIPEEVQARRNVKSRLENSVSDIERAERLLKEIKKVVGDAVIQYSNADAKMAAEANKFL